MVKDHSESERQNQLSPLHDLLWLAAREVFYMQHPTDSTDSTYHGLCYTSCGALAGTRNNSMGRPITLWVGALPQSYILHPVNNWGDPKVLHPNHCFMTGVTKAVLCAILCVGWCI